MVESSPNQDICPNQDRYLTSSKVLVYVFAIVLDTQELEIGGEDMKNMMWLWVLLSDMQANWMLELITALGHCHGGPLLYLPPFWGRMD